MRKRSFTTAGPGSSVGVVAGLVLFARGLGASPAAAQPARAADPHAIVFVHELPGRERSSPLRSCGFASHGDAMDETRAFEFDARGPRRSCPRSWPGSTPPPSPRCRSRPVAPRSIRWAIRWVRSCRSGAGPRRNAPRNPGDPRTPMGRIGPFRRAPRAWGRSGSCRAATAPRPEPCPIPARPSWKFRNHVLLDVRE
jgi:hypothetical protein